MNGRDGPDAIPARIFLRPIGTPLTVGLSGLVIASLVESGFSLSWVGKSQVHDVGLILIAVPFTLQLIACVFSYLARDGAAGAALGILSTTWLGLGLVHLFSAPGSTSGALGLLLLAGGGLLALSSLAIGIAKPLPAVVFGLAAIRFIFSGIYELNAMSSWQDAAGMLPTFRIGAGRKAVTAAGRAQLEGVATEAGVREMT